jgi:hypothetical protein
VDHRLEAARGHVAMNKTIRNRHPSIPGSHYPKLNAKISETVLGMTPHKFMVANNLKKKRKNRKGKDKFPKHPNGREIMTKPQIATSCCEHCLFNTDHQVATTWWHPAALSRRDCIFLARHHVRVVCFVYTVSIKELLAFNKFARMYTPTCPTLSQQKRIASVALHS